MYAVLAELQCNVIYRQSCISDCGQGNGDKPGTLPNGDSLEPGAAKNNVT